MGVAVGDVAQDPVTIAPGEIDVRAASVTVSVVVVAKVPVTASSVQVPSTTEVWPARQDVTEEAPSVGLTEPTGVSRQVAAKVAPKVAEYLPARH